MCLQDSGAEQECVYRSLDEKKTHQPSTADCLPPFGNPCLCLLPGYILPFMEKSEHSAFLTTFLLVANTH